jgi:hypothetical protein
VDVAMGRLHGVGGIRLSVPTGTPALKGENGRGPLGG